MKGTKSKTSANSNNLRMVRVNRDDTVVSACCDNEGYKRKTN